MSHRKQRRLALALIMLVLIGMSVGAVFAYLSSNSDTVRNDFSPDAEQNPAIKEEFEQNTKSGVMVNVGSLDYAVYVRAVIVVTWKDANGNVYAHMPVADDPANDKDDPDYTITLNTEAWFEKDGFYYLRTMVPGESDGSTPVLINLCKPIKAAPQGYTLSVEIIAQTIQALGTTDEKDPITDRYLYAVEDAWKVVIVNPDGTLSSKP